MGGISISSLALSSGQTLQLPLGSKVRDILAGKSASEVARMITEAALKSEQDEADTALARKLKRRMIAINTGKTTPLSLAQVQAKYGL